MTTIANILPKEVREDSKKLKEYKKLSQDISIITRILCSKIDELDAIEVEETEVADVYTELKEELETFRDDLFTSHGPALERIANTVRLLQLQNRKKVYNKTQKRKRGEEIVLEGEGILSPLEGPTVTRKLNESLKGIIKKRKSRTCDMVRERRTRTLTDDYPYNHPHLPSICREVDEKDEEDKELYKLQHAVANAGVNMNEIRHYPTNKTPLL